MRGRSGAAALWLAAVIGAGVALPAVAATPVTVGNVMKAIEPELVRLSSGPLRVERAVTGGETLTAEYRPVPMAYGAELTGPDGIAIGGIRASADLLWTRTGPDGSPWTASTDLADPWFMGTDPAAVEPLIEGMAGPLADLDAALARATTFSQDADPACPGSCTIVTGVTADPVADPSVVELRLNNGKLTGARLVDAGGTELTIAYSPASGSLFTAPAPLTDGLPEGLVPAGIDIRLIALEADGMPLLSQALGRGWAGDLVVTDKTYQGQTLLSQVVTQHAANGDFIVRRTDGTVETAARRVGTGAWLLAADGYWTVYKDARTLPAGYTPVPADWIAPFATMRWVGAQSTIKCPTGACIAVTGFVGGYRSTATIDRASGRLVSLDLRGLATPVAGARRSITFDLPSRAITVTPPKVVARPPVEPVFKVTDTASSPSATCVYGSDGIDYTLTGFIVKAPRIFWPGQPGETGLVSWRAIAEVKQGKKWVEVLRSPAQYRSLATVDTAQTMPDAVLSFTGVNPLYFLGKPYRVELQVSWFKADRKTILKTVNRPATYYVQVGSWYGEDALGVAPAQCQGIIPVGP